MAEMREALRIWQVRRVGQQWLQTDMLQPDTASMEAWRSR